MSDPGRQDYYKLLRQLGMMTFIPMILVSGPLAGFLLGKWLDMKFKTGQGPIMALLILGFLAGVRESVRIIQKVNRELK